jgi:hypothetical protein
VQKRAFSLYDSAPQIEQGIPKASINSCDFLPRVRFMRIQALYVAIMAGLIGFAVAEPAQAASGAIKAALVSSTDGACATDSYNANCASGIRICLTYLGTISGTVGTGGAEIDATEDLGLEISQAVFRSLRRSLFRPIAILPKLLVSLARAASCRATPSIRG